MSTQAVGVAHGRVNLIGEHTDYNDGFAMPTAIPQRATIRIGHSPDDANHVHSVILAGDAHFEMAAAPQIGFSSYVQGCIEVLRAAGYVLPPVSVEKDSDVPIGVGLSSSAALEVATLRALRTLFSLPIDDLELARFAQRAEIEYAGVRCGLLDQLACSLCAPEQLLLLDMQSFTHRLLPMPPHTSVVVLDTGTSRSLAGSGYNQRRSECEEAARLLQVDSLRSVADLSAVGSLPDPLNRRVRHVVTENQRVLAAVSATAAQFGELMNASHLSLDVDYGVSTPALNTLVGCLRRLPGVLGARLTGAGFGGACVELVEAGCEDRIRVGALQSYAEAGYSGKALV